MRLRRATFTSSVIAEYIFWSAGVASNQFPLKMYQEKRLYLMLSACNKIMRHTTHCSRRDLVDSVLAY